MVSEKFLHNTCPGLFETAPGKTRFSFVKYHCHCESSRSNLLLNRKFSQKQEIASPFGLAMTSP
jgi:hypothetical protein